MGNYIDSIIQKNNQQINSDTCQIILDTAKTIYNEEFERFKQAEAKTSITLALLGVIFISFINYLIDFTLISNEVPYIIYTFLFKFIILICFTLSTIFFLNSIKTNEYDQVSLENIVNNDFARENNDIAKLRISKTYYDAIEFNRGKIEYKMKQYNYGMKILSLGFILFVIHFIIEEVIKYVI